VTTLVWLTGREVADLLSQVGYTDAQSREFILRVIGDRGVMVDREADPARDWFKLSHQIRGYRRSWQPDPSDISWPELTVIAPAPWQRVFVQSAILCSAAQIRTQFVGLTVESASGGRPSTKLASIIDKMRRDISAGQISMAEIKTMKLKQLSDRYGGSLTTAGKAREEIQKAKSALVDQRTETSNITRFSRSSTVSGK